MPLYLESIGEARGIEDVHMAVDLMLLEDSAVHDLVLASRALVSETVAALCRVGFR